MKVKRTTFVFFLLLLIVLFVAGYVISDYLYPRTTEEEFQLYEKVAWDIFEQYEKYHMLPIKPDGVQMRIDGNTIYVGKEGIGAFSGAGYVEGVTTRDEEGNESFETKRVFSEWERIKGKVKNGLTYCSIPVLVLVIISTMKVIRKKR